MANKLYVGGLSYGTTVQTLTDAFAQAGQIAPAEEGNDPVIVITDKMTGRSKGFGFVTMATDEDAKKAIEMWDGKELDGRVVKVNEARPLEDRPPRRDGGFNRGGGRGGYDRGGNRGNWS